LLECAHHASVYGQVGKSHLVAAKAEDNDEYPREARGMHRLTGNHRYSLKNGLKTEHSTW
jgi:hypothetical protein